MSKSAARTLGRSAFRPSVCYRTGRGNRDSNLWYKRRSDLWCFTILFGRRRGNLRHVYRYGRWLLLHICFSRRGFRISIRRFGVQRSLFRSVCISLFFRCDGYEFSGEWQYATPVLQFICQGQWCNDSNYKFRRLGFSQQGYFGP